MTCILDKDFTFFRQFYYWHTCINTVSFTHKFYLDDDTLPWLLAPLYLAVSPTRIKRTTLCMFTKTCTVRTPPKPLNKTWLRLGGVRMTKLCGRCWIQTWSHQVQITLSPLKEQLFTTLASSTPQSCLLEDSQLTWLQTVGILKFMCYVMRFFFFICRPKC